MRRSFFSIERELTETLDEAESAINTKNFKLAENLLDRYHEMEDSYIDGVADDVDEMDFDHAYQRENAYEEEKGKTLKALKPLSDRASELYKRIPK